MATRQRRWSQQGVGVNSSARASYASETGSSCSVTDVSIDDSGRITVPKASPVIECVRASTPVTLAPRAVETNDRFVEQITLRTAGVQFYISYRWGT